MILLFVQIELKCLCSVVVITVRVLSNESVSLTLSDVTRNCLLVTFGWWFSFLMWSFITICFEQLFSIRDIRRGVSRLSTWWSASVKTVHLVICYWEKFQEHCQDKDRKNIKHIKNSLLVLKYNVSNFIFRRARIVIGDVNIFVPRFRNLHEILLILL